MLNYSHISSCTTAVLLLWRCPSTAGFCFGTFCKAPHRDARAGAFGALSHLLGMTCWVRFVPSLYCVVYSLRRLCSGCRQSTGTGSISCLCLQFSPNLYHKYIPWNVDQLICQILQLIFTYGHLVSFL